MNYEVFAKEVGVAIGEKFKIACIGNYGRYKIKMANGKIREATSGFAYKAEKDGIYRKVDGDSQWENCKNGSSVVDYEKFICDNFKNGLFVAVKVEDINSGDYYFTFINGEPLYKKWEGDEVDVEAKASGLMFFDVEDAIKVA